MRTRAPQPQRIRGLDRLPALILVALSGCNDGGSAKKPPTSRVAKVEAEPAPDPGKVAAQWCDATDPKPFTYPGLSDGAAGSKGTARWINVWATWCKPCVEELPRIQEWRARLPKDGARVGVELLAADEPEAFTGFLENNPAAKDSMRLTAPDDVAEWVGQLGLTGDSGLPLHLFVDAKDQLRCARLGGVGKDDYANVLAVIRTL